MLVVMETLSPLERGVFILKEVFGFSYGEIAGMLDRSETTLGIVAGQAPAVRVSRALVNGEPGLLVTSAGVPDDVVAVDLNADNRIQAIRLIRNPDKLRHISAQ